MAEHILRSYKLKIPASSIFEVLSSRKKCFFLDSSLEGGELGRYSFLGIEPFFVLKSNGVNPFKKLKECLRPFKPPFNRRDIPFLGGAVGYLSYDLGLTLEEKIKAGVKLDPAGIPDCVFAFYNTAVIIDHYRKLFYILSLGYPEKRSSLAKCLAEENFKKIHKLLSGIRPQKSKSSLSKINAAEGLISNFTRAEYIRAVRKAKEYITSGDIYQVNLSQQFKAKSCLGAFEIYQRLRSISPSYFGGYFDAGGYQIISSSPERFLKLTGDKVTTRPMKGTRPRSMIASRDKGLKRDLLMSAKDKAELMMIVDLERNDLGRVCGYNSITVPRLRQLERYNTVFQTTATIEGKLHKDKDRFDLLRACFPGGSVIGCPKIRAMEIIDELEPAKRSIYTGCLGYLSFSGDMEFNILIRSILKKGEDLYFGSGGGIVADSNPADEYQETLVKARGILKAISAGKTG